MAAIVKATAKQTTAVSRASEGADVLVRALRDGTLTTAAFFQALALEGRVFCANAGSVTTPITLGGTGAVTTTEPDLFIIVPSGTAIMPIFISYQMEAFGTHAIFEVMAAIGTGNSTTAPTGGTAVVPTNLRTDLPRSSNCTVYSGTDAAGATYMTTNVSEFWRDGLQLAVTKTTATATIGNADFNKFSWSAVTTGITPVLIGAGGLMTFGQSQAATGFVTCVWAELPAAAVS